MTTTNVLCEGAVVGRIMKSAAAPVGQPWLWTLAYGHHEDHTPTHGYEPTLALARLRAKDLPRSLADRAAPRRQARGFVSSLPQVPGGKHPGASQPG